MIKTQMQSVPTVTMVEVTSYICDICKAEQPIPTDKYPYESTELKGWAYLRMQIRQGKWHWDDGRQLHDMDKRYTYNLCPRCLKSLMRYARHMVKGRPPSGRS